MATRKPPTKIVRKRTMRITLEIVSPAVGAVVPCLRFIKLRGHGLKPQQSRLGIQDDACHSRLRPGWVALGDPSGAHHDREVIPGDEVTGALPVPEQQWRGIFGQVPIPSIRSGVRFYRSATILVHRESERGVERGGVAQRCDQLTRFVRQNFRRVRRLDLRKYKRVPPKTNADREDDQGSDQARHRNGGRQPSDAACRGYHLRVGRFAGSQGGG